MTLVQTYLRDGGTLDSLTAKYAIHVKRHRQHPNLVLLKYDQLASPMGERLVQECRCIILDEANDWRCVSRSFDKFFNHGEGHAAAIDWSTARVQEKVDGSLCTLYWYEGWQVATSGTPDASGPVYGADFSFADLFWRAWDAMGFGHPSSIGLSLMFELTSPWNRIVVPHHDARLTLLGVRDPDSGEEYPAEQWPWYDPVRSFPLQSLDSILSTFETMSPLQQEGYVVVDAAFNRIKVKHPGYVAIHHAKDGFGPRRMLEMVRAGETSEILAHFPEWAPTMNRVRSAYEGLVEETLTTYERLRSLPDQKTFALAVQASGCRCSSALYQMRAGRILRPQEYLAQMPIRSLAEMLGVDAGDPELAAEAA